MDKKKPHFINQPEYPGGPKALTQFIYQHLAYPEAGRASGVEGTVVVEYDIDNKGRVTDARVIQGLGHEFDEEACRVVRLLKFDVGRNRGLRVVFHKKAFIRFRKPAPQPVGAAMQVQYTVTASPAAEAQATEKPAATYTYTISL